MLSQPALAALIAACRKVSGLQQARLAGDLGLSPAALSHIENTRTTVSERFLNAFAERLYGPVRGPQFVSLVEESDDDDIDAIAAFVAPTHTEEFSKLIVSNLRKIHARSADTGADLATFQGEHNLRVVRDTTFNTLAKVPSSTAWAITPQTPVLLTQQSTGISDSARRSDDSPLRQGSRDHEIEAIRHILQQCGFQPTLTSQNTLTARGGVRVRVDLVDHSARLALDVRQPGQYGFRFLAEMLAKTVLLHEIGYRFIVCFTEEPVLQLDLSLVDVLARHGGQVTWIDTLRPALKDSRR